MLEGFQGPFVKSEDFTFRDVTKLETIDEMGDLLGNEHPVARKIQDLCLYSESFCDNPGLLAYITVPGTIRPGSGAVCKTSRLLGENVVLQNPERRDSIVVVTLGSYFGPPCVDREHPDEGKPRVTKENLIQLSEEDQKKLFPDSARGSFLEALTFPNPPGTVSAPVIPDIADVSAGSDGVAPALAEPIYIRAN